MIFEERIAGNVAVLRLTGHFFFLADGGDSLVEKMKEFVARGFRKVLFDFSQVARINSAGIGVLIACLKLFMEVDGSLKICSINDSVESVFKVANVYQMIDVFSSYEEALKSFPAEAML